METRPDIRYLPEGRASAMRMKAGLGRPRGSKGKRAALTARFSGVRRSIGAAAAIAVCLGGGLAVAASASAAPARAVKSKAVGGRASSANNGNDGLGIKPGKIKHVWLIILENKSYDATFTGLNNNTYLWKTLPAQGVLLKNYYGTGHFSLDNYVSMVSGQATQPDTQADCPYYDTSRDGRHLGQADDQPQLRPDGLGRRGRTRPPAPTAASTRRACRRCSTSSTPRTSAGRATPRTSATPTPAAAPHRRRRAVLRRAVRLAGRDRDDGAAQPGQRERDRPVRAQALPVPVVRVDPAVRRLQRRAHRQPVRPGQRPLPRPAERGDDAGVQLDLAEQLQRRARRRVPRQQPVRRLLRPEHAEPPVNYTGGLYAADLFLEHVDPRDRGVAGVQGRRPDRHHLRRGVPAVHLHRQQLRQLDDVSPNARPRSRRDTAAETLFGHNVNYEPTGPEHAAGHGRQGNELYPGPGDNAFLDRPPTASPQTVPAQPAGTCLLGGGSTGPGPRPTRARPRRPGTSTIADNAVVATDPAGRSPAPASRRAPSSAR